MKFNLSKFRDLGKCSFGTLLDEWDTKRDRLLEDGVLVEINKVSDLFPYLWRLASGHTKNVDGTVVYSFLNTGEKYWWAHDEAERVMRYTRDLRKFVRSVPARSLILRCKTPDLSKVFTNFERDRLLIEDIYNQIKDRPYGTSKPLVIHATSGSYKEKMTELEEVKALILADNP